MSKGKERRWEGRVKGGIARESKGVGVRKSKKKEKDRNSRRVREKEVVAVVEEEK